MASKGHGNGQHKKGKKGTNNLPTGQYTAAAPPPPPVTTTLPLATTNILPPPRANISLPNIFFMPPPPHQFQPSSPHNSLHSISLSVLSISSTPSLFGLRIGGASTSTSPSIDSATASNATTPASLILRFKEVVEFDGNGRLIIARDGGNGFIFACSGRHMIIEAIKPFYTEPEYKNGGKERPYLEVYEEIHRKKNKDGTKGDWVELRARIAYEDQKSIEE
ncbi:hypothetical protein P3S68_017002 [Capsicum galapagoense]